MHRRIVGVLTTQCGGAGVTVMSISLKLRIVGSATLTGLYFLFPPFSSGGAWGQYLTRSEFAQSRTAPLAKFRTGGTKHPEAFVLQPAPAHPSAPTVVPIAMPVADPNSALGSTLASCDKASEGFEALVLPGARGEVKLDRCYRGRDHFVCSFNALMAEASSLLENYTKITNANYPELSNLEGICRIKPETLAIDLQSAADFNTRFKELKAQYVARLGCASSIQQSFRDATLSDMTQAPDLLKSMFDTIEGDMKGVVAVQAQVAGLAERIDSSQKAMNTIQKVHRSMCAKNQIKDAENQATR
jgi:hypothetical protein